MRSKVPTNDLLPPVNWVAAVSERATTPEATHVYVDESSKLIVIDPCIDAAAFVELIINPAVEFTEATAVEIYELAPK